MSVFDNIRGTIETIFQIGLGGPQVKDNSGTLEAKNSADSAYADLGVNDLKLYSGGTTNAATFGGTFGAARTITVQDASGTLAFLADVPSGITGAQREIQFTVGITTASSASTIPSGAQISEVRIEVTTPYDGTTPAVAIGNTAIGVGGFVATSGSDLTTAGTYIHRIDVDNGGSADNVDATITGGSITVGAATITVFYAEPDA